MMQEYTLGVARWPERAARERGMTLAEYLAWEREKNQRLAVEHRGDPQWAAFCERHLPVVAERRAA